MTESEWWACDEPRTMLDHIRERASPRQLRYFACACLRAVWHLLSDSASRAAVEVAERFALGQASASELASAGLAAFEVVRGTDLRDSVSNPACAAAKAAARAADLDAFSAATGAAFISVWCAAPWTYGPLGGVLDHGDESAKARARSRQCELIREVFGNPFRPAFVHPGWLAWNGGTVLRLARGIFEEQRYDELPVLGDALEEAGCSSDAILGHCRRAGGHVRGCWVLDLVLTAGGRS